MTRLPATLCLLALALPTTPSFGQTPACADRTIEVRGHQLYVDAQGTGPLTVVFEAGNGNHSVEWTAIAAAVRGKGVRTFAYDRSGLGRSELADTAYEVGAAVGALRTALATCGVSGPIILVGHSYGGVITLLLTAMERRVAGVVLVDAVVPFYFTPARIAATLGAMRPDYAEVRREAPALAASVIPLVEAFPRTMPALDSARIRADLPVTVIVAEKGMGAAPQDGAEYRRAVEQFLAGGTRRAKVVAWGSGHNVMREQPEVVITAVEAMIDTVRRGEAQPPG